MFMALFTHVYGSPCGNILVTYGGGEFTAYVSQKSPLTPSIPTHLFATTSTESTPPSILFPPDRIVITTATTIISTTYTHNGRTLSTPPLAPRVSPVPLLPTTLLSPTLLALCTKTHLIIAPPHSPSLPHCTIPLPSPPILPPLALTDSILLLLATTACFTVTLPTIPTTNVDYVVSSYIHTFGGKSPLVTALSEAYNVSYGTANLNPDSITGDKEEFRRVCEGREESGLKALACLVEMVWEKGEGGAFKTKEVGIVKEICKLVESAEIEISLRGGESIERTYAALCAAQNAQ